MSNEPAKTDATRSKAVFILAPLAACLGLAVVLLVVALVAGEPTKDSEERSGGQSTEPESTTSTTASTTTTTQPVTTTTAPTTTTAEPTTTTAAAPPSTSPPVTEAPAAVKMPNVVCRNLQDAQDDIQRAGVFLSNSEDATGQGRSQVIDSGWMVVRQTPAVGTLIEEGDPTLYVVRTGEPNDC